MKPQFPSGRGLGCTCCQCVQNQSRWSWFKPFSFLIGQEVTLVTLHHKDQHFQKLHLFHRCIQGCKEINVTLTSIYFLFFRLQLILFTTCVQTKWPRLCSTFTDFLSRATTDTRKLLDLLGLSLSFFSLETKTPTRLQSMSMWPGQFLQLATAALLVDEKLSRSRGVKKVFQLKFSLSWNCSACCFHSVKQNLEICDGFIMTDINKKKKFVQLFSSLVSKPETCWTVTSLSCAFWVCLTN